MFYHEFVYKSIYRFIIYKCKNYCKPEMTMVKVRGRL
jgi:hypothetical protein